MFEGFERRIVDTGEVSICAMVGGKGPPLLLMHGYPQTHAMWHKIAPRLAERFTVVATDLRGYGDSSKPVNDSGNTTYSKRSMARDQIAVMQALGHEKFLVVGHDRGGRCGYRMALDHPERVEKLVVIDIIPTAEAFGRADRAFGMGYYHWFFLAQPYDLPERMIGADPDYYWRRQIAGLGSGDSPFAPAAEAAYLAWFRNEDAIHASCSDYRAGATTDVEHDEADRAAGRLIECPLLVLWGVKGKLDKWYNVLAIWRNWARNVQGRAIEGGHYLPEECPEETLHDILAFMETRHVQE